jgi:hypothetical protein
VDSLERCGDAGFEDSGDRFPCVLHSGFLFEEGHKWVLAVACDEEGVVAVEEVFSQGGQAVLDRIRGVVFVVDAFGARGGGEVFVRGLLFL